MTTEQKAKAYDEALKKANAVYKDEDKHLKATLERIFPELAESEDEKVRQKILFLFYSWRNNEQVNIPNKKEVEKAISWLERQGEHANFRNKIQVGDKVTRNENGVLVNLSQLKRVAKPSENRGEQKTEENKGNVGGISPNWSEEDENILGDIIEDVMTLHSGKTIGVIRNKINWLKSLRPLKRWKPSDEHISLLQAIINEPNNAASESCQIVLKDILEQLKKLKEE